mmetsp:Transcript_37828/g.83280  ORF Transcript_37828/g.83280 Transcript_37828/m.83280 type:complete len:371 (+) Transcript_37828:237-1349(+)
MVARSQQPLMKKRTTYDTAFKVQVVREALQRPVSNRIKPTCARYPGIEPCQLRKWIRNLESEARNGPIGEPIPMRKRPPKPSEQPPSSPVRRSSRPRRPTKHAADEAEIDDGSSYDSERDEHDEHAYAQPHARANVLEPSDALALNSAMPATYRPWSEGGLLQRPFERYNPSLYGMAVTDTFSFSVKQQAASLAAAVQTSSFGKAEDGSETSASSSGGDLTMDDGALLHVHAPHSQEDDALTPPCATDGCTPRTLRGCMSTPYKTFADMPTEMPSEINLNDFNASPRRGPHKPSCLSAPLKRAAEADRVPLALVSAGDLASYGAALAAPYSAENLISRSGLIGLDVEVSREQWFAEWLSEVASEEGLLLH